MWGPNVRGAQHSFNTMNHNQTFSFTYSPTKYCLLPELPFKCTFADSVGEYTAKDPTDWVIQCVCPVVWETAVLMHYIASSQIQFGTGILIFSSDHTTDDSYCYTPTATPKRTHGALWWQTNDWWDSRGGEDKHGWIQPLFRPCNRKAVSNINWARSNHYNPCMSAKYDTLICYRNG